MNFTNKYIFLYASGLVIVVATLLSFTATKLKPIQDANIRTEKKQNILSSVGIASTPENAESLFDQYITKQIVINGEGKEEEEGVEAFNVKLEVEIRKEQKNRNLPVYQCTMDDGKVAYIFPVRGKGLWGPIWGYVALEDDFNTIYGVTFDHKCETPGLGAEINKDWFMKPFKSKTIFEGDQFVSITVHKGGAEAAGDKFHGVDAISGGTITSKALENMLKDCLGSYQPYLKNKGAL